MQGALDISALRTTKGIKNILKKAGELNDLANRFKSIQRNIKINIKNLNPAEDKPSGVAESPDSGEAGEKYVYQRYVVDSSCNSNCEFIPLEEKDVFADGTYQEILTLKPYSVQLILFKKKPRQLQVEEPLAEPETTSSLTQPDTRKEKDKEVNVAK